MLALILALLFILSFPILSFPRPAIQANTPRANFAEDRVIIQRRRVVLVRSPKLAKHFSDRKTAVVIYPVVSGLTNPLVLRRVRSLLTFKNIFDYSLDDYRNDAWLSEFDYLVNHNGNYLLDITFTQSGMAAYPDEHSKHFLINLKDGSLVKASEVFEPSKLAALAAMVDSKLQTELKQMANENASMNDMEASDKESLKDAHRNLRFEVENLDEFSVGRKGITFLYDAGFPHVIKAFEPEGRYFFSYSELKPYIKRNGSLRQFVM